MHRDSIVALFAGNSCLSRRDDTPLRLLTSFEIATLGGYATPQIGCFVHSSMLYYES